MNLPARGSGVAIACGRGGLGRGEGRGGSVPLERGESTPRSNEEHLSQHICALDGMCLHREPGLHARFHHSFQPTSVSEVSADGVSNDKIALIWLIVALHIFM